VIRRFAIGIGAASMAAIGARMVSGRATRRLLDAPRTAPGEAALGPALDALGGEIVRFRARDGVRLGGRWLPAEAGDPTWTTDPREAILLLHGYTGSCAPDLVEYGPYLRRTAAVLGIDFRGHGASDDGHTTFGVLEVEDIAGALAWLGERGIRRVALFGTSMGGISALAAVAVLGDGSLAAADVDPAAPRHVDPVPRPDIVAVIADSVAPELEIPIASRLPGPARGFMAARLFDGAARTLGADPRATEPIRVIGLVAPVPLLLIHGAADSTVPVAAGRRLAAAGGPTTRQWIVPGAEHSAAHAVATQDYERTTTDFLRVAVAAARTHDGSEPGGVGSGSIIAAPGDQAGIPTVRAMPVED
jgi:pimeloyl-ACP methyl ester carboxylesterase